MYSIFPVPRAKKIETLENHPRGEKAHKKNKRKYQETLEGKIRKGIDVRYAIAPAALHRGTPPNMGEP